MNAICLKAEQCEPCSPITRFYNEIGCKPVHDIDSSNTCCPYKCVMLFVFSIICVQIYIEFVLFSDIIAQQMITLHVVMYRISSLK